MLSPSPDPSTTNKIIASGFSAVLSHDSPTSFNSSVAPFLASPSGPSTAVRWINCLFFVSLILSLAAAFFGILAKQWLREYMQWNLPMGAPRENVLVRQMRIEAWEAWNVDATIATIPVLLEVAMILFLAGIVILLWTLDDIVAIVVTVFTSLFLFAVSIFTVLPIFSKRCPYKSPTAWACVVAFSYISYPVRLLYAWYLVLRARWKYIAKKNVSLLKHVREIFSTQWAYRWGDMEAPTGLSAAGARSWRDRDLSTILVTRIRRTGWWPRYEDARTAAERELAREDLDISKRYRYFASSNHWDNRDADALLRNISETSFLIRSLSWVERASQDTRVHAYIAQSLPSIHTDMPEVQLYKIQNIRAVTLWSLISLHRDDFTNPHSALREVDPGNSPLASTTITSLRRELGIAYKDGDYTRTSNSSRFALPDRPEATILGRILPTVVDSCISKTDSGNFTADRRTCEWITIWDECGYDATRPDWHVGILRRILCSGKQASIRSLSPAVRSVALRCALSHAKVTVAKDREILGKNSIFISCHFAQCITFECVGQLLSREELMWTI
jgi:hypothetical protein